MEDYNAFILLPGDNTKSKPVAGKDPAQGISLQPNPVSGNLLKVILTGYDQPVTIEVITTREC